MLSYRNLRQPNESLFNGLYVLELSKRESIQWSSMYRTYLNECPFNGLYVLDLSKRESIQWSSCTGPI